MNWSHPPLGKGKWAAAKGHSLRVAQPSPAAAQPVPPQPPSQQQPPPQPLQPLPPPPPPPQQPPPPPPIGRNAYTLVQLVAAPSCPTPLPTAAPNFVLLGEPPPNAGVAAAATPRLVPVAGFPSPQHPPPPPPPPPAPPLTPGPPPPHLQTHGGVFHLLPPVAAPGPVAYLIMDPAFMGDFGALNRPHHFAADRPPQVTSSQPLQHFAAGPGLSQPSLTTGSGALPSGHQCHFMQYQPLPQHLLPGGSVQIQPLSQQPPPLPPPPQQPQQPPPQSQHHAAAVVAAAAFEHQQQIATLRHQEIPGFQFHQQHPPPAKQANVVQGTYRSQSQHQRLQTQQEPPRIYQSHSANPAFLTSTPHPPHRSVQVSQSLDSCNQPQQTSAQFHVSYAPHPPSRIIFPPPTRPTEACISPTPINQSSGSNTSQDGRIQIEEIISERSGEGTAEGFASVESNPTKKQLADSAAADNVVSVSAGQSSPEAMSSPNVRTPTSGPSSGPIPNSAGSTTHSSTLPESESSNMREESRFVADSRPEGSPHCRPRHSSTESSHGYPSEMERMVSNLLSNSSSASHGEDAEEEERSEKTRQPNECTVAPLNPTTAPMNDEFVVPPPPRRRGRPRTRARLEEAPRKTKTAARNCGRNTVRTAVSHPTLHRQEERSWTTYRDNFNMHLQNMLSTLEDGGSPGFDVHRRPMIRRPESDPQVENSVLDEARAQKFKRDLRELLRQIQGLLPPRKARAPELRAVNEFVSMMRCWEEDECGGGGTGGLRSNDCDFVLRTLEETRRWVLNPCPDRSGVHIRQRERNWRTSASRSVHMMMRAVANALTMPPLKDSETQTLEGDDLSSSTIDSPPPQIRLKVMRDFSHSPRRDEPLDNDSPAIPNLENSSNHIVAGGDVNRSENRSHVHPYIQTPVARAVVNRGNDMHRPRAIRATRRQQEGSNATEAGSAPTRVLEFRATPRSQACNSIHTTRGPDTEAPADVLLTKTRMVALNRASVASSSNHQNYRGSNTRQQPLPSDTSSQTSSSSWKKPPNNTFRPPTPPVRNSSTPNRQQHRLAAMRNIRAQPPQTDSGASASASASASISARSTNGDSRRATERDSSEENHDWVYLKRGTYSTPLKEHASHRSSTGGVTGPSSGSAVSLISAASGGMSGPAAIALTCGRASSPGSDERRISPHCPGDTGCPKEPIDLRPIIEKPTSHDVSHEMVHAQGISSQMCDYSGETRERQEHMGPGRSDSHVTRTSNSVSHTMIKKAALSRGKQYRSNHSIDSAEHQNAPKFSLSSSQENDNLHIRGWQENTAHIPPFHPDSNLNHNYRNCSNTNIHESTSNRSETNHLANTCQIKSEQNFLPDTNRVGWHVPHGTSSRYPSNSGVVKSCFQSNGGMSQGDCVRHEYHTNAFNQTRGNYVTSVQDIRCHRPEMMDTNQKSRQMCESRESQDSCRLQNCQKSQNDVKNVQPVAYRDHLYPCNQNNRCAQRQSTYKDNDFQRIKDIPCQQTYMGLGHEPPLVYPPTACRMNANVNHAENWPPVNNEATNTRQLSQNHTDINPSGHNGMKTSQRSDGNISFGINSNAPPYVPPPDRNRSLYENCDKSSETRSLRPINNTNNSTISYCGQKRQAECKYSSQLSDPLHLSDHMGRSGFSMRNGQSGYRMDSQSVEHCNAYNNPSNSMGGHWETPNVRTQTWNCPETPSSLSASQILQGDSSVAAENNVNQFHFSENMQENIPNSWQSFSAPSGCAVQQQHETLPQCNSPEFEVAVKQERSSPCRYPVYDHLVPQIPLPVSDVKVESDVDDEEANIFSGKSYVPSREVYEYFERNSRKTTQAIRQSDNRKTFVQEVENLKEDTSKKDKNGEKINFAHQCSLMAEKLITKPSSVDSCMPFSLRSEGERPCCENEPNDSRKNDKSDSHPSNENDQRVESDWQTFRQCGKARKSKDCERKELNSRKGEDVCAEGVLHAEPGPRSTPSSLYALSKSCEEEDRTTGRCSPAGSSHSQKRKRDDHGESLAQGQRKLGATSTAAIEKTAADNGLSQELDTAPSIKHVVVENKRVSPDAKGMSDCIRSAFFTSKMQDMIASKLLSKQPDEDIPVSIKDVLVKVKQNKYSSVHLFALETRKIIQAAKRQFDGEKLRTILDASNKFELSLVDRFPNYDFSSEVVASESEENPSLESDERHKKPPKHFYKGASGHESRKARHQTRTEHEGVGGDGGSNPGEVVVRDSTTRPELSVSVASDLTYVGNSFPNAQRPPQVIWPPVPRRNSEISNTGGCIVTATATIRIRTRNQNRRTT